MRGQYVARLIAYGKTCVLVTILLGLQDIYYGIDEEACCPGFCDDWVCVDLKELDGPDLRLLAEFLDK